MTAAALGREHPRTAASGRQTIEQRYRCRADRTKLCSALRVIESDAPEPAIDPNPGQGKRLHSAEPGEEKQADGIDGCGTLAGPLCLAHHLPKRCDFVERQKAALL